MYDAIPFVLFVLVVLALPASWYVITRTNRK